LPSDWRTKPRGRWAHRIRSAPGPWPSRLMSRTMARPERP
jgi:hypothetical protein